MANTSFSQNQTAVASRFVRLDGPRLVAIGGEHRTIYHLTERSASRAIQRLRRGEAVYVLADLYGQVRSEFEPCRH